MQRIAPARRSPNHHKRGRLNGVRHVNRGSWRSKLLCNKRKVQLLEARLPIVIGVQAEVAHDGTLVADGSEA